MDAIGAIAGSSLEQTTWLRRNLEVKPSPKIMVDGNNLESDAEGDLPLHLELKIIFVDFSFVVVILLFHLSSITELKLCAFDR